MFHSEEIHSPFPATCFFDVNQQLLGFDMQDTICAKFFNFRRSGGVGAGKGGKSDLIDISKNGGKKDYQNVGLSHA